MLRGKRRGVGIMGDLFQRLPYWANLTAVAIDCKPKLQESFEMRIVGISDGTHRTQGPRSDEFSPALSGAGGRSA